MDISLLNMKDNVSIKRLGTLHPKLRGEMVDILIEAEKSSVGIRITSAFRTPEEQDALFAQGRTLDGNIVTNAKAWQSFHNYGLAVDICLLHKDGSISYSATEDLDNDKLADFTEIVNIFKQKGWEWAGDWKTFKERPHFQKSFGYSLDTLKDIVLNKKNLLEGKYPNI